ncbi:MAG: hypothetical protein LWY06_19190 [Firmicutes bacterium]|nr:hypothetical protein [Bacillota bacterium]
MSTGGNCREFLSVYPAFLISMGILFIINLVLVHFASGYVKKKKIPQAAIFCSIALVITIGFYFFEKPNVAKAGQIVTSENVLLPDPGPPKRDFSYLSHYDIIHDDKAGAYFAKRKDDEDEALLCLVGGNPPQLYDSSFYILMQNEGRKMDREMDLLDMAKLMLILYYHESEPVYFYSSSELERFLSSRADQNYKKLGKQIAEIIKEQKSKPEPKSTGTASSEQPESKNGESALESIVKNVSAPVFELDYDGGKIFKLYTFSLRYRELTEWSFKITTEDNIEVERTAVVNVP